MEEVFSQATPNLFTPGIVTSTRCETSLYCQNLSFPIEFTASCPCDQVALFIDALCLFGLYGLLYVVETGGVGGLGVARVSPEAIWGAYRGGVSACTVWEAV